jgi:hypothetical protein
MIIFRGKEYSIEPPDWWWARAARSDDKDARAHIKKWNDFWIRQYGIPRWVFRTPEEVRPWWRPCG